MPLMFKSNIETVLKNLLIFDKVTDKNKLAVFFMAHSVDLTSRRADWL